MDVVGRQVGAYRIEAELGRGAMGVVFRARSVSGVDVALKCLLHGASTPSSDGAARRFADELAAARALRSPHVVPVLDGGRDDELGPWIAFELQRGGTLAEALTTGPLAPQELVERVLRPLAAGLEALHAAGIVHRDLKPENLFFSEQGVLRIGDLGLARFEGRQARTATGAVLGTPGYVAPERFGAATEPDDPRIDVYAMAGIAVTCLTAAPPFPGAGVAEILNRQLHAPPPPAELEARGVPPFLAEPLSRNLSPEAGLRDGSAAAFLASMERSATGEVRPTLVLAKPSGARARGDETPRLPSSRRRWGLPMAVLALLASVLLLVARPRSGGRVVVGPRGEGATGSSRSGVPSADTTSAFDGDPRGVTDLLPDAGDAAPQLLEGIWQGLLSVDSREGGPFLPSGLRGALMRLDGRAREDPLWLPLRLAVMADAWITTLEGAPRDGPLRDDLADCVAVLISTGKLPGPLAERLGRAFGRPLPETGAVRGGMLEAARSLIEGACAEDEALRPLRTRLRNLGGILLTASEGVATFSERKRGLEEEYLRGGRRRIWASLLGALLEPTRDVGWAQAYFAAYEILEARHFMRMPGTFDSGSDRGPGLDDATLRLCVAEGLQGMARLARGSTGVARFEHEAFFRFPGERFPRLEPRWRESLVGDWRRFVRPFLPDDGRAFARALVDAWIDRARGRGRDRDLFGGVMKRFLSLFDEERPPGAPRPSIAAFMQVSEGWAKLEIGDGRGEALRRWLAEAREIFRRRLGPEEAASSAARELRMYLDVMEASALVGEGRGMALALRRRLLDWELDDATGNARREQIRTLLLDAARIEGGRGTITPSRDAARSPTR